MFSVLASLVLLSTLAINARAQRYSADSTHSSDNYWRKLAFAFDHGRPTVFSGIDSDKYPHKQFLFSAAGLTTQALIDEAILDIPHSRGGAIERGILAGGIGTTLFYVTIGRNASVSDISVMARTSSLSKTQLSLIFGGFNAIQALRIVRDPGYEHFFVRPTGNGLGIGVQY